MLTGDMLRRSAERFPSKAAVVCNGVEKSYRDLERDANRCAHALLDMGLAKGAKVAILSRNRIEYVTAFFGASRTGLVFVNVSVLYALEELVYVLDKADVEVLFYEDSFAEKVKQATERLPKLKASIVFGAAAADELGFEDLLSGYPDTDPGVHLSEDDPFCMTYTGGTTGRPKGVLASHRNRVVTAHTVVVESGITDDDVVSIVTPLFHVAALNIMLQPAVLVGATTILLPKWDVSEYARLSKTYNISASFMVPTQVSMIVSDDGFEADNFSAWRKLNFSGAPMPDWVQRAMLEKLPRVRLTQFYGQSEMGIVAALKSGDLPGKLGSVGRQVYNADLAVLDPDGKPVQPGEVGEIVARGDNVMLEYYGDPGQTSAFWRHGWAWSGDLATVDADGFLTLVDRSKDMIISGGENIYPKEIENVLYEHHAVAECAVFGIPDDKWGEVPAAHVQLKSGAQICDDDLVNHCMERLARFKRPRLIKLVTEFPKTPIGKIQKNVIREEYWAGRDKRI
ncbi:AMP-binding protein [Devosia sp. FJ2-5-3]|uniref:class I adenylate-forming enzyme family protein n=1 Tax=Devosia sp. FJ2-5-3 TaxID=2976680 RepID=UPI0023D81EF2|nr:AMP-binding protein [Devosia sp. FJ2-5-3]WEJ58069.1 AMP-binding protein [Devosia sp. FJ2-5-3]